MPLALSLRDRVDSEVRGQARSQAQVVASAAAELVRPPQPRTLDRLVESSAAAVRGRVIVVGANGRLLADSAGAPLGRSYAGRPEIDTALAGDSEQITRYSETLDADLLATAVPIVDRRRTVGAARITQSVDAVDRAIRTSILDVAALAAIVMVLGTIAGALIASQIVRPIRRLDRAARRVAGGDLDASVAVEGSTEQRSLARTFNEMTERLKRLLGTQQEFVADASHQLRTPLTGLRLRLEGLGEMRPGDAAVAAEVDAALREVDRLSLIVDELLILSRAGEREVPAERVDLGDAVRRAAERWEAAAAEHGSRLEVEPGSAGTGWCPRPDLDRTIDVLVENAILYSQTGAPVRIAASPGLVEVLDRGPGLRAGEEEEEVFERFHRGSAGQRAPGGTGLGLPIARELSRRWGGEVRLEERPGGGLRAVIEMEEGR